MRAVKFGLALAVSALMVTAAAAQQPLKIGFITTLSGPGGYIGADVRDAFQLAIDMEGGKLGGVPVQLVVEDDGLKPGQGKQIADKMMKTDGIKLFTGIIFSNVLGATAPDILDGGGIYVSPNAGPSNFAGKDCHKNYFVVSWQNDTLHESAGQNATNLGYKKAFILAPNYQAGKDALAGFKRFFKGEIIGEVYTRLDQTDYAPEMAQIRAAKPDVVFHFHPGGLGIAFARQYQQAGLLGTVPLVVAAPSVDVNIVKAVGEAAIGTNGSTHWNTDFDNPANKKFMDAWMKKYNRLPTYYAGQAYDTALAIGAALEGRQRRSEGSREVPPGHAEGGFRGGARQVQVRPEPASDPGLVLDQGGKGRRRQRRSSRPSGKIMTDQGDAYSKDCKL